MASSSAYTTNSPSLATPAHSNLEIESAPVDSEYELRYSETERRRKQKETWSEKQKRIRRNMTREERLDYSLKEKKEKKTLN